MIANTIGSTLLAAGLTGIVMLQPAEQDVQKKADVVVRQQVDAEIDALLKELDAILAERNNVVAVTKTADAADAQEIAVEVEAMGDELQDLIVHVQDLLADEHGKPVAELHYELQAELADVIGRDHDLLVADALPQVTGFLQDVDVDKLHKHLQELDLEDLHEHLGHIDLGDLHEHLQQIDMGKLHDHLQQIDMSELHDHLQQIDMSELHDHLQQIDMSELHDHLQQIDMGKLHDHLQQIDLTELRDHLKQIDMTELHDHLQQIDMSKLHDHLQDIDVHAILDGIDVDFDEDQLLELKVQLQEHGDQIIEVVPHIRKLIREHVDGLPGEVHDVIEMHVKPHIQQDVIKLNPGMGKERGIVVEMSDDGVPLVGGLPLLGELFAHEGGEGERQIIHEIKMIEDELAALHEHAQDGKKSDEHRVKVIELRRKADELSKAAGELKKRLHRVEQGDADDVRVLTLPTREGLRDLTVRLDGENLRQLGVAGRLEGLADRIHGIRLGDGDAAGRILKLTEAGEGEDAIAILGDQVVKLRELAGQEREAIAEAQEKAKAEYRRAIEQYQRAREEQAGAAESRDRAARVRERVRREVEDAIGDRVRVRRPGGAADAPEVDVTVRVPDDVRERVRMALEELEARGDTVRAEALRSRVGRAGIAIAPRIAVDVETDAPRATVVRPRVATAPEVDAREPAIVRYRGAIGSAGDGDLRKQVESLRNEVAELKDMVRALHEQLQEMNAQPRRRTRTGGGGGGMLRAPAVAVAPGPGTGAPGVAVGGPLPPGPSTGIAGGALPPAAPGAPRAAGGVGVGHAPGGPLPPAAPKPSPATGVGSGPSAPPSAGSADAPGPTGAGSNGAPLPPTADGATPRSATAGSTQAR